MLDLFLPQIFLGAAQRKLLTQGTPVFAYHFIGDAPHNPGDPFLYLSPEKFDDQLAALREAGFTSGTLPGLTTPPAPEVGKAIITFDDGCRNVFEHALPILARHQFTSIEFIVAGLVGKTNEWDTKNGHAGEQLMDSTQIREWLAAGHEIGSHSLTHRNLSKLDAAAAREQIFDSKKLLEDEFGIEVRHFCYPHGKWNQMVRDLVAEAGYKTACTTAYGVRTADTDAMTLPRIFPLSGRDLAAKFRHRLISKFS